MQIEPSGQACGARVTGCDLSGELDPQMIAEIRAAWLEQHTNKPGDATEVSFPIRVTADVFGPGV